MRQLLPAATTAVLIAATGCGFADARGERLVVAHRAAAGYFPENSRTAVRGSIDRGHPALEVDIVLTKDAVPVLAHDPWVSVELCTTIDGAALEERILIKDLTLEELQTGFQCGGLEDPDTPDAEQLFDRHMTLDELIAEVRRAPTMAVYLDLKYGPDTLPIEDFEREILGRWRNARLANPLYVESTLPEGVRAFADENDLISLVGWPRFEADSSGVGTALGTEFAHAFGTSDPVDAVQDLGADGFTTTYQLLRRRTAITAREEGLVVVIFTLNEASLLSHYCGWPVDLLISDYPERAPCL